MYPELEEEFKNQMDKYPSKRVEQLFIEDDENDPPIYRSSFEIPYGEISYKLLCKQRREEKKDAKGNIIVIEEEEKFSEVPP